MDKYANYALVGAILVVGLFAVIAVYTTAFGNFTPFTPYNYSASSASSAPMSNLKTKTAQLDSVFSDCMAQVGIDSTVKQQQCGAAYMHSVALALADYCIESRDSSKCNAAIESDYVGSVACTMCHYQYGACSSRCRLACGNWFDRWFRGCD